MDHCSPYMQCILMDSPTNKDCKDYIRIKSLTNLINILDSMFYAEGGVKEFEKNVKKKLIEETNRKN